MATKRTRRKIPAAGEVVREIHTQLMEKEAAGDFDSMLPRFELALQARFRGAEEDVRRKLQVHVPRIRRLNPPPLTWVDLGCGRGEWLDIASGTGADIIGVDRNEFMIERCLNRNLSVVRSDALAYLQQRGDSSCAVLTAFHLLENCEFPYILGLMREAARVLSSGGVFVMETPNAANQKVAGYQFWLDPMHLRPMPRELMEFAIEYFGLRVEHFEGLNPHQQHGSEDYTILAVR